MKPFVDAIGSSIMLLAVAAPMSCVQISRRADVQPFIAAAGAYALLAAEAGPTPAPPATGCTEGCRCNGTGKEKSGDGIAIVECRCPDSCECKKKKPAAPIKKASVAPCPNGTCQWPTRSIVP